MVFGKQTKYILVLLLFVVQNFSFADNNDQHIKVALRSIGHNFLLQLGDSTSRVLPIHKKGERYLIQFENEFGFEPEQLSEITHKALIDNLIFQKYIVEVIECNTNNVVYSFETDPSKDLNVIPCKGRALPNDCYEIYFSIIDQPNTIKDNKTIIIVFTIILLALIFIGFIVYYKRKNLPKNNSEFTQIGEYQFDKKGMKLILKSKEIELSGKEVDLLELLFENESKTLERDIILNKVWGDEGDYIGRTLDVFISKLRKKLEHDPNLKIINVRGVGYRLVIG